MFRFRLNSVKLETLIRTRNCNIKHAVHRCWSTSVTAGDEGSLNQPVNILIFNNEILLGGTTRKIPFEEMIKSRRQEASKSLVIQVASENSYQELSNYCSQFGDIKSAFHYKTTEEQNHFILLEFQEKAMFEAARQSCHFNKEHPGITVSSPFIWFKALKNSKKAAAKNENDLPKLKSDETKLIHDDWLKDLLRSSEKLDDQIMILYRATCLNDLGIRMRFLAAQQLEAAMSGMFPFIRALPFGSSVNSFGKMGCDLDMILQLHREDFQEHENSRLVYHTKESLSNERSKTQRHLEVLGDILHLFLPGVKDVRRILQARVPIIKYNHECLELEVDLSMGNLSGFYMSELLYLFGEIDERVRPLTFCVRKWASATNITNPSPGRWISNFSLTLLVIYFLQNLDKPVLPTLHSLVKAATKNDIRIVDDNINCTFLRDLNSLQFQSTNSDNLSRLLTQFFEFYSLFDFKSNGISLNEGKPMAKPDHSALWILNPLESFLNVSKNVSHEEVEKFRLEVKNAAWILESSHRKTDDPNWGLLQLFRSNKQAVIKPQMFFKSRLVDVSDLFNGSEPQPDIKFNNADVKNQVNSIRNATKKEINKLYNMKSKQR